MKKILHHIYFNFDNQHDPFTAYLETWKKQLPDFEIMMWDHTNLPLDLNAYTAYMAKKKKYAFLSDYFRCWLLNKYGGVYLDTDIEILDGDVFRKIYAEAQMANNYTLFIGIESSRNGSLSTYAMGVKCGETHPLLDFLMKLYETAFTTSMRQIIEKFPIPDVMSLYFMELEEQEEYCLTKNGCFFNFTDNIVTKGMKIYTQDYFSPITNFNNNMMISAFSENTCLCHHFAATWKKVKNKEQGRLFSDLLNENYYVIPPEYLEKVKHRYPHLQIKAKRPIWSLNPDEVLNFEKILNAIVPYGGILYSFLRKLRKR